MNMCTSMIMCYARPGEELSRGGVKESLRLGRVEVYGWCNLRWVHNEQVTCSSHDCGDLLLVGEHQVFEYVCL